MNHARLDRQPDLFQGPSGSTPAAPSGDGGLVEPPDAAFVDGVRRELTATLARVEAATDALPWRDLTAAYLAELRFRSISRWLPGAEAARLVTAFDAELDRLYAAPEPGATPAPPPAPPSAASGGSAPAASPGPAGSRHPH